MSLGSRAVSVEKNVRPSSDMKRPFWLPTDVARRRLPRRACRRRRPALRVVRRVRCTSSRISGVVVGGQPAVGDECRTCYRQG